MNRVFASDKSSSVSDKRVFRAVEGIYGELDEATTDIQALVERISALETSSKDHLFDPVLMDEGQNTMGVVKTTKVGLVVCLIRLRLGCGHFRSF